MFSFHYSQEVLINILVYYHIITDIFNDIKKEGDYKLVASRLQNFMICFEMFLAGLSNWDVYNIVQCFDVYF